VLWVLSAIFRSVFLNRLVIYVVSLSIYVKDAHFCVWVPVCLFEGVVGYPMVGVLFMWIGNPLFNMVFTSSLYSSLCMCYVFSLLCRNVMAAYLSWAGWFEEYGITVSVKEGFLYMEIFQLVGVLWKVTSRKFSLLLVSVSAVNFMFGWSVLKSFCMLSMSLWLES